MDTILLRVVGKVDVDAPSAFLPSSIFAFRWFLPLCFTFSTANEFETTVVGSVETIDAHFSSGQPPLHNDVSFSQRWRVFRIDSDADDGTCSEDGSGDGGGGTRVVEMASAAMGNAGISVYYTASVHSSPCLFWSFSFAWPIRHRLSWLP
jgi:hypothetical protein